MNHRAGQLELYWRSPMALISYNGCLYESEPKHSAFLTPDLKPGTRMFWLFGLSPKQREEYRVSIPIQRFGQRLALCARERRRLSRHGRRYPRRMPRSIIWEARFGTDDPGQIPWLIERALEGAPFRELMRG